MGYRIPDPPELPRSPEGREFLNTRGRNVQNLSTPLMIYWTGDTSFEFAFPCTYRIFKESEHHRMHCITLPHPDWTKEGKDIFVSRTDNYLPCFYHHHYCCDSPHHYKHSCHKCCHYVDMTRSVPIHFLKEGYTTAKFTAYDDDNTPVEIDGEAWIDEEDDWVIRVHLERLKSLQKMKDLHYWFSLVVDAPVVMKDGKLVWRKTTQMVAKGQLLIDPTVANIMLGWGD